MHGVAERQQAGLAKQDVIGEREHNRDADQVKVVRAPPEEKISGSTTSAAAAASYSP